MPTIFFLLTLLSSFTVQLISSTQIHHNRRILHQPFFPLDSPPATSQPPSSSQQPKHHPFSSQSPPNKQPPFFPIYPSPPPPLSTTSLPTFPANISSLIPPQSSSSKHVSRKLIAIAVLVALLSVALIAALVSFLLYHGRHRSFIDKKASRSDNFRLFPANTVTSDGGHKPPSNASNSSSDFLYLGTPVNLRDTDDDDHNAANSSNAGPTSVSGYQKLGSPELHPLPPLPRQNFRQNYRNAEVGAFVGEDNEEEEFFSPRGSSGGRGSPIDIGSGYRRRFQAVEAENFRSRSSNSRTASYPFSNRASPTGSMSSNPSMPLNFSPRSLISRSPDSVVNFSTSSPPLPAIPHQSMSKPLSPSLPSSSPEMISGKIHNLRGRISDVSAQNRESSAKKNSVSGQYIKQPPPPPPRFWETPVVHKLIREPISGLPVLVAPSRPVVFQSRASISPTEQAHKLETMQRNEEAPKPKLKPLHWDKVRASSDHAMVWDQLKSSSFQLNEEMIETLFMVNASHLTPKDKVRRPVLPTPNQENRILDPKKSQNIAILLRALNVTIDEVCEALLEGNADGLGTELLESLLKMAPTKEEERKLKEFKDESPFKLGPAEKFLKAVLDIPFAFKRVDAMLYIANFDSEVEYLKRSFKTLEVACKELRNSRMFLKLLEAVLKTGNRMNVGTNRGEAHAFKLDTLLKLVDVKGTDGKTTLLHFVVQEIIRAEGSRLSVANQNPTDQQSAFRDDVEFKKLGLQVVSGLSGELTNVKKAAAMDSDVLSSEVAKLASGITKVREIVKLNEEISLKESSRKFSESMTGLLKKVEEEIIKIQAQENVALSLVKEITEYFHGNTAKEEAHPFRLFMVVRDFLWILDQVCKEVGKINERSMVSSARPFSLPVNPNLATVFPGFGGRRQYSSSQDENSPSP